MAITTQSDFSASIVNKIRTTMEPNLRANLVFHRYADEGEINKGHGTLVFTLIPDLSESSSTLDDDGANPTAEALSLTTYSVTPSEIGRVVSVTRRARALSPLALVETAAGHLAFDARRRVDTIVADAAKASGTARYSGTATARNGVSANIASADVRKWGAKLESLNAMPYNGYWECITDPFVIYDLQSESGGVGGSWQDINRYATPETIKTGQAGRMYGSSFNKTTQSPVFAAAGSGSVDVYTVIALGKGALGAGKVEGITGTYVGPTPDHADALGRKVLIGYRLDMGATAKQAATYVRFECAATAL